MACEHAGTHARVTLTWRRDAIFRAVKPVCCTCDRGSSRSQNRTRRRLGERRRQPACRL